ncbi:uncharacterized protein ACRADG_001301 [Cochliomyia hominivorax]
MVKVEPLKQESQIPAKKVVAAAVKSAEQITPATGRKAKTTVNTRKKGKTEESDKKPIIDETITSEMDSQKEVHDFDGVKQEVHDSINENHVNYVTKVKTEEIEETREDDVIENGEKSADDLPYKCSTCERRFKTNTKLRYHQNTHLGIKPYSCKDCEMAFTTSGELLRHVRYRHTHIKPYKCTECDYSSVEKSKLQRHMRSHTGERPYQCPHCTYASPDTFKLKRHMRIHTGEKPFECDICHARFSQSNTLKDHQRLHNEKPDKPISCKRCKEELPNRYSYKMHMKTHENEKCYRCELCSYAAMERRHLESHMFVHLDIKPFVCEICQASFRQKHRLNRHKKVSHTDNYAPPEPLQKDHKCPYCDKIFARNSNLIRHMEIHDQTSEVLEDKQKIKIGPTTHQYYFDDYYVDDVQQQQQITQHDVKVEVKEISEDEYDKESEFNENSIQNGYNELENENYKEQINQNEYEEELQDENMLVRNIIEVKEEKLEPMDIQQSEHEQVIGVKADVGNNESDEIMATVMNNDQDFVDIEVMPDEDEEEEDQEIQLQKGECRQPPSSPETAPSQKTEPANLNKKVSNVKNTQPVISDCFGFAVDAEGRRSLRRYKT